MAALNQVLHNFQQQAALFNRRVAAFFSFLAMKLKNFKSLSIQEQVSFGLIGIGMIFIVTAIVLFIL
jgi:hypothetical protein